MILHIFGYIFIAIFILTSIMGLIIVFKEESGYIGGLISCLSIMILTGFAGGALLGRFHF